MSRVILFTKLGCQPSDDSCIFKLLLYGLTNISAHPTFSSLSTGALGTGGGVRVQSRARIAAILAMSSGACPSIRVRFKVPGEAGRHHQSARVHRDTCDTCSKSRSLPNIRNNQNCFLRMTAVFGDDSPTVTLKFNFLGGEVRVVITV